MMNQLGGMEGKHSERTEERANEMVRRERAEKKGNMWIGGTQ